MRKARNASQGFSDLIEQRRQEELWVVVVVVVVLVVVPKHHLNGGNLDSFAHDPCMMGCTFEMHSSNKGTRVHPAVLSWFGKNWKKVVSSDNSCLTLNCFTEYTHKNSTKLHMQPNYHDGGPWYNWALVSFREEGAMENVPCRLLLFYDQQAKKDNLSTSNSSQSMKNECGIMSLVQTSSYQQVMGTPEEHKDKMYDTDLLSHRALTGTRVAAAVGSPSHNLP
jgi:hypothetical protein